MPTVRKSAIVDRSAAAMFALVDAVERYPEFLPWCSEARVLERSETVTHARMAIDFHGLKTHFSTLNRKAAHDSMQICFVEGPFERFEGLWSFQALGETGCRVEFTLEYTFESHALEALLGPAFGHIAETMMDRFVRRCAELGDGLS